MHVAGRWRDSQNDRTAIMAACQNACLLSPQRTFSLSDGCFCAAWRNRDGVLSVADDWPHFPLVRDGRCSNSGYSALIGYLSPMPFQVWMVLRCSISSSILSGAMPDERRPARDCVESSAPPTAPLSLQHPGRQHSMAGDCGAIFCHRISGLVAGPWVLMVHPQLVHLVLLRRQFFSKRSFRIHQSTPP